MNILVEIWWGKKCKEINIVKNEKTKVERKN
jgi:hypothetical protein